MPGLPLTTVNTAFEALTGYSAAEAVGKNCRFLQGAETEQHELLSVVSALRHGTPVKVEMTNYRSDGSAFRNALHLKPVFDKAGVYR